MALSRFGSEKSKYNTSADFAKGSVNRVLSKWAEKAIKEMREILKRNKREATGNLIQSIDFKIKVLGQETNLKISLADYWKNIEYGRGVTKSKTSGAVKVEDNIYKWIASKGINVRGIANEQVSKLKRKSRITMAKRIDNARKGLAFVIARKIHKKGFKGTKFFSKAVNKISIGDLKTELSKALKRDVILELKDLK